MKNLSERITENAALIEKAMEKYLAGTADGMKY